MHYAQCCGCHGLARASGSAVVTGYCVPLVGLSALDNPTMPSWLSKPLSIKSICVKGKNVLVTGRGAQLRGDLSRRDECELRSDRVKLNEGNSIVWTVCKVQCTFSWYTKTPRRFSAI